MTGYKQQEAGKSCNLQPDTCNPPDSNYEIRVTTMETGNDKSLKGLAGRGDEEGGSLFAIFHPAPAPAPCPVAPAPAEDAMRHGVPMPPPPSQDREMNDYLKAKLTEMESKLRESQEKGLAFAYELKGREEARKESRREMEEFLAAVKRQQADSETERARGLELEKARARIEALELKIMELSAARPEPPVPPKPEPPGPQETQLRAAETEKLRAGLREDLAAEFNLLGAKLADKILKEAIEPLAACMGAELRKMASAMEDFRSGLRDCQVAIESSKKDVIGIVEGPKRALVAGGAQAADSAAGRLVPDSAPYDLGFITACFDNLEKSLLRGPGFAGQNRRRC